MAERWMRVELNQVGPGTFEAKGGSGGTTLVEGSPEFGGSGQAMRPMELLLTAVAACSALDVVLILRKQKEPLERLEYSIEGSREDTTPAPFKKIRMHFVAHGPVDAHKLSRAVGLGVEKYCSAKSSLDPQIEVTWTTEVRPGTDAAESV